MTISLETFLKLFGTEVVVLYMWIRLLTWDNGIHNRPRRKPEPKERTIFKRKDTYPYD